MGREDFQAAANPDEHNNEKPRQVRGIADRMPRLVDPKNPEPRRDSIFLCEAKDYPAAVIAIEFDNATKPICTPLPLVGFFLSNGVCNQNSG